MSSIEHDPAPRDASRAGSDNFGLRLLRHVHDAQNAGTPIMTIEQAVHRLTGELADWYQIDAGHLRMGDRADLVIVDPAHLDASLDAYA